MGNLARGVLFRMPSARLYFCLLIARYMLSDKIKGKSALKARTFLHERDKVHVCYWYWLNMHLSTEKVQATCSVFKYFLNPSLENCLPDGILQQWSLSNMDFLCHRHLTDMPRARIRSYIYREKTPISAHVHHEGLRSYAAWSSKLNICKLQ